MTDTIIFEVTPSRVRNAANVNAKRDLSTNEAATFISLFHDEIDAALAAGLQSVIKRHFGTTHPITGEPCSYRL